MDELTIDGKTYVSSKRAAAITGYAKDYIGQLCREGRVEARLVGRSWYVYEPSLRKHRFSEEEGAREETETITLSRDTEGSTSIEEAWERPIYESEEVKDLPLVEDTIREEPASAEEPQKTVEEIESAWQDWFTAPEESKSTVEEEWEVQPQPVPVHLVRTPQEPEEEPRESVDIPRREPQAPIHVERSAYLTPPQKQKQGSTLVLKAILVAVMLIAISIAVVGSGLSGSFAGLLKDELGFIKFLEGTYELKK